jgi:hypothetical protein
MITNTKCEKCIFKISENSKQIGCELQIDKIITQNYPGLYDINTIDKSGDSWILKNFKCMYARTHQWLDVLKSTTNEQPADKVIKDRELSSCFLCKSDIYRIFLWMIYLLRKEQIWENKTV